ncbi:MAG TPA: hypothetical protein DIT67_09450 [Octadecabacter sp.]|nr:hypothetical protein [Octadecabacter sp.]
MTKDRICATATGLPEDGFKEKHEMYYGRNFPDDAADKIAQFKGLSRIGAAASDTVMCINLDESGYLSLFEVIHRLCDEIGPEIDTLQHKAKVGLYAGMGAGKAL